MGYMMFSNNQILPHVDSLAQFSHETLFLSLFSILGLAFIGVTLAKIFCYGPFMKRFKIFGRKTKRFPSYDINNELSLQQLYKEFQKTKKEIRLYQRSMCEISPENLDEVKLYMKSLK